MQVSIPVGIFIMACIWSLPVLEVYLIHRFIKWQEWRKREPVVEVENIYDKDGELETQITRIDGVPRMIIGKLEGEGF